jgi:protein-S-isoprenylcysteine O-methyltransferase Ste14
MRILWIRAGVFTLLVPCVVGLLLPYFIYGAASVAGGLWQIGWLCIALGATLYGSCLFQFLISGGTPAIFFARHLRVLIGEEPHQLVRDGLYQLSRNPMYLGVLLAVFGQAIVFASIRVACYGVALWLFFHLIVVFQEEPHLRRERGPSYDEYRRRVPRWLGWPK